MKSIRLIKTALGVLGLLFALAGASVVKADVSYLVDINTAAIANNAAGPFYIDFQSTAGSFGAQTITVSNFSLTGGGLLAGTDSYTGAASGSLSTSLVMNPNSGSYL